MPTQRQVLDQPLGNGMMQRHVLDPQTGEYQPYGEPFAQFSPGRGKSAKSVKADPLEAIVQHATGGTPAEDGLGSLPGGAPLANYAPQQNPVPPIVAGGAVPGNAREPMRVPGTSQQSQYPGAPAVGTIRKGYKYLGGNPADKASWSKI
ncbi:hypothetical protein [Pseudomonas umsongensis]|uniref:Uncharacterized protein n=1 Tax=Pseudomonas umsongensis TaxID=198618 RepID=A0AAE6ZRU8_9PSED|nr:hypothetical protein [Pseudomonas umsongensis]QJC78212.1 hypothetical protein HGP31_07780 [Pseudomonas umsongensis]